jgi:hypothetical protein
VTVIWPEGTIANSWLRVTVRANERTDLPAPDTFYFGNLIGDTNDDMTVSPTDLARVRAMMGRTSVPITEPADVNKDGAVTPRDFALVRANLGRRLVAPSPAAAAPPAPEALLTERVWDEEAQGVVTA